VCAHVHAVSLLALIPVRHVKGRRSRSGGGSGISRLGALRHCGRAGQSFKMHGLGGRRPSEMSLAVMGGESARTLSPYRVRCVCVCVWLASRQVQLLVLCQQRALEKYAADVCTILGKSGFNSYIGKTQARFTDLWNKSMFQNVIDCDRGQYAKHFL